jgi:hypothetical protein
MNAQCASSADSPRVFHCESGRWLALSPDSETMPRIGVLGDTEAQARAKFREALARWLANLNS